MTEYVCTAEQMRTIDRIASEKYGIPSIVLMENAASACVREIEHFNSFTILCGKGNNGGDGMAIARMLINKGKNVKIYAVLGTEFLNDALINYDILKKIGAEVKTDLSELEKDLLTADCVIDAIFGTGTRGEIRELVRGVIESVNRYGKFVLSVDVPSGINSDTGEAGVAVRADKTITFAGYKRGLFLFPGAELAGEVVLADISIPRAAYGEANVTVKTLTEEYIRKIMPKRRENSHKGDYGKIFVIGGSVGMAGAVCMVCEAAFKAGAGIVTACVPREINDIVQCASVQTMTFPVDFEKDTDKIIDKMRGFDAVLFGNGIGRGKAAEKLLSAVLKNAEVPVVIDADGLFALAKNPEAVKQCRAEVIITPHTMEFARLCGTTAQEIEADRFGTRGFAKKYGLTLVLKGKHSIITAPDGAQSVNTTGNSGMATAGSGDVLAGMTAAFAARKILPFNAAELAVYLHGSAGDAACRKFSAEAMTAPDIISAVSQILPVEIGKII